MLAWRVSKLLQSDLSPTPMIVPTTQDHARKRAAIECSTSQFGPLNADHALAERIDGGVAEQFWMQFWMLAVTDYELRSVLNVYEFDALQSNVPSLVG
jgi:hypothetical protein